MQVCNGTDHPGQGPEKVMLSWVGGKYLQFQYSEG